MRNHIKKVIVLLFTFTFLPNALAEKANIYECTDELGLISAVYSLSGLDGKSQLYYSRLVDGPGSVNHSAYGDQITQIETSLGLQVSTLVKSIPDHYSRSVTFILPTVNTNLSLSYSNIYAHVVETVRNSSIGGLDFVEGQVSNNHIFSVVCKASSVNF